MKRKRWTVLPFLALLLPAAFLLASCGDDDGGTKADVTAAQERVRQANASLEQILYEEFNGPDPDSPSDVDFNPPYSLYSDALALDPANLDAHFGAAVTGLLILSTDTEVNAAFDEWKQYLDTNTPFEVESSARAPLGIPIGFQAGSAALRLPYGVVTASVLAQAPLGRLHVHPQIERVQAILEDRVLPKALAAVTHLGLVSQNAGYRFIVTPRMQGDEDEDPAEIDRTDVLALRAGCSLLAAACRVAVSYNLGFAAYDSLHLYDAMQPGSGWLTLRTGGGAHMLAARASILSSIDDLDAAITSLLGETDSQDDDVIKIGSDELARADAESVQVHLPDVRESLSGGHTRIEDWDGDSFTPDVPLTIDIGAFFSDPVTDWKALLPSYSARVVRRALDTEWRSVHSTTTVPVNIPEAGYYSATCTILSFNGHRSDYFWGSPLFEEPLRQQLEARLAEGESIEHWTGSFNGYASVSSQWFEHGEQQIEASVWANYETAETMVFIPVITWDAQTFDGWTVPDPTFDGLLPDVGSTSELWTLFGIEGDGWEREWVIDWPGEGIYPPWRGSLQSSR